MGREKKISDEQLEEEVLSGKTQKEIAFKHGYGYPSRTLSKRIKDLGFRKNNKLTVEDWGGAKISIPSGVLNDSLDFLDTDLQPKDDGIDLFFFAGVVGVDDVEPRSGDVLVRPTLKEWRRETE